MTTLLITRGLPGCGKTTFAQDWVAEDPERRARVNRDSIREMMHRSVYIRQTADRPGTENAVTAARDASIRELLKRGVDVINDDTNLPSRTVRDLRRLALLAGAEFQIKDLTNTPLHLALDRNLHRLDKDPVPEQVINDMYQRYIHGQPFPLPVADEPETGATADPYIPLFGKPQLWLVDIDGTVALKGTRDPFDESQVHLDAPNEAVIAVVRALVSHHAHIGFLSGRTDACRGATEEWLKEFVLPDWRFLLMRPVGDTRKDAVVKRELFDLHIRHNFWVRGVLDDRNQVVNMWRNELGLPCLQVAPGDF